LVATATEESIGKGKGWRDKGIQGDGENKAIEETNMGEEG
jgi:hypothetical protein